MSKKRTETGDDEQRKEDDLGLVFKQVDKAKRSKLSSRSDTTLPDLPMKLLERILVEAVAMEVKGMKLAKSVWKEKADLVISRLRTVCSQWNSILTTNTFRNELHRILDGAAQKTIRLEILHQLSIQLNVIKVITLKDEMFMLCRPNGQDYVIHVYDRTNMEEVKDVIPLQGLCPWGMAACSLSNCVYLLHVELDQVSMKWQDLVVLRIARDEEHQFDISGWIGVERTSFADISVAANGNVIFLSKEESPNTSVVSIFDVNGSKQHEIQLPPDIYHFRYVFNVIQKSNGNLLLVCADNECNTKVLEIDTFGKIVLQYQSSSLSGFSVGCVADTYGRILITDWRNGMELLDFELNLLELTGPRLIQKQLFFAYEMQYDGERNEIVRIDDADDPDATVLTIFRFAEE